MRFCSDGFIHLSPVPLLKIIMSPSEKPSANHFSREKSIFFQLRSSAFLLFPSKERNLRVLMLCLVRRNTCSNGSLLANGT